MDQGSIGGNVLLVFEALLWKIGFVSGEGRSLDVGGIKDWIQVYAGSEYHLSEVLPSRFIPNVDSKDLRKLIEKIPTYVGLERIMRFALLRFLHTNGIYIHCDLDS